MNFLLFTLISVLFSVVPILATDPSSAIKESKVDKIGLEKRGMGRWMKSLFRNRIPPATPIVNNGQQSLSDSHRSVSLAPLKHAFKPNEIYGKLMQLPSEIQLRIYEYISMTFKEAQKIALKNGASIEWADVWAIQHHDPVKDKYSLVKKWLTMDDSNKDLKENLKEKLMLNPTIKKLFEWEGGLDPSSDNLLRAIRKFNPHIVKYLIAIGMKPDQYEIFNAVRHGSLDTLKILLEGRQYELVRYAYSCAIGEGPQNIFKFFIEEVKFKPTNDDLNCAIQYGNLDIIKYLVEEVKMKATEDHLYRAIKYGNHLSLALGQIGSERPDIVKYFIEEGKVRPNGHHMEKAIEEVDLKTIMYLVNECQLRPTRKDLVYAIQIGNRRIIDFLSGVLEN